MPAAFVSRYALCAIATCCVGVPLGAQAVVRVIDRDSVPIPFALFHVAGGSERVVDSLGRGRLSPSVGDSIVIAVRRLGYSPFHGVITRTSGFEYVVLLEPVRRELAAVRTVAPRATALSRSGFYDRMQRVQNGAIVGSFITPEELERRNPTLVSQVLQGLPSIRVQRHENGQAVILGRGGCAMTVLLDGQRMNGSLQELSRTRATSINPYGQYRPPMPVSEFPGIDQLAAAREVMAVEVYNSTANAPAELIPLTGGGSCGIIALWTGPRR